MRKPLPINWLIRIQYALFLIAVGSIRLLPTPLAFGLGDVTAAVFYAFDSRHRRRVTTQLLHTEMAGSPAAARRLAWRCFRHLGRAAVEIVKAPRHLNPETVSAHIQISGDPAGAKLLFGDEGVPPLPAIVVTAHYGNWEIAGLAYALTSGIPLTTVVRPFDNPLIGRWVRRQRQGYGHLIQGKAGALRGLLAALRKGESVCIVADQHATRTEGVETLFFGHPARTHVSPAQLHLHTGVPIVAAVLRRSAGTFRYEFRCSAPIRMKPSADKSADLRCLAQSYTTALEGLIRHDPVQWLWAHRRWLDIYRRQGRKRRTEPLATPRRTSADT